MRKKRRALVATRLGVSAALALTVTSLAAGCSTQRAAERPTTPAPGRSINSLPAWLPEYSAEQQQLLATPAPAPVTTPAPHVYPLLDHFTFADHPGFKSERAAAARQRVDQVISASRLLYVTGGLPNPAAANWVAQYGPLAPGEPDPWVRAVSNPGGKLSLIWATPSASADRQIEAANASLGRRDLANAESQFAQLCATNADVPALWILLGEVQAARGDDAAALQSAQRALSIDPRSPDGHRLMAVILAAKGNLPHAKRELALALAAYPASARSWAVAKRYFNVRERPAVPPSFLEVGLDGSVRVSVGGGPGPQAYLRCRAAVRYEPDFRKTMLGLDPPYRLSMGEELMCHEVWLAAEAATTGAPRLPEQTPAAAGALPVSPATPGTAAAPGAAAAPSAAAASAAAPSAAAAPGVDAGSQLRELATHGHLPEYVLFDVIGRFRPEWLRVAPRKYHIALAEYVERYVLN